MFFTAQYVFKIQASNHDCKMELAGFTVQTTIGHV